MKKHRLESGAQTVKKLSASSDTVGAAIRRPRSNCEAIVAVFEENKKMIALGDAILLQNCRTTNGRPYRGFRCFLIYRYFFDTLKNPPELLPEGFERFSEHTR